MKDAEGEFMIYEKTETKPDGAEVVLKEIHVRPSFV